MGSVTGTESDSTLKMRLTPIFALIILSCLLLNFTSAQRSASRKTSKNCRGPSSRPSSSRPSSSRPSSSRGSTGGRGSRGCRPHNQKPTTPRPTTPSGTSGSSRKPWKKLPKKKKNKPTSGTSDSSVPPTDEEGDSVPAIVEERDSVPSNKKIKAAAKKYLGKVKDKLQSAAIWFVENKDKTIDDILVERWKEKCPGGASTKNKRKRCVSDALAESDDDTPEEKLVKDALKSLLEEDSDEAYEFLSTSSSRTFGDIEKEEETQENSTPDDSNSSRNPFRKFKLPKKKSKSTSTSTSGNLDSSRNPLRKFKLPKKKVKPTPSPDSPTDEETDPGSSSRRRIKTSAKKYLQKVKDKLKVAAVWYLENKDKTIDQILVDKWKEKCPGGISTKKKRKQCVSDALADSDDDTPEEKEIMDALKSLVEEDSDGAYDFLSKSSSRTFGDIENEEEIQDKLSEMPEKYEKLWEEDKSKTFTELESEFEREKAEKMSKLSNDIKAVFSKVGGQISTKIRSWSRSCTKKSRTTQSRKCQNEAGRSGQKKQKCREAQSARRRSCLEEVFEPTPEDSLQDRNIKAELEELAVQDPETGTQLVESCQIPGKRRVKRQLPPAAAPAAPAPACALPLYIPSNVANAKKHFLDKSYRQIIIDAARTGNAPGPQLQAVIDELGGERVDAGINTVLADNIQIDLTKFTAHGIDEKGKWKNGAYYDYKEYVSNEDFEFVQITWVPNLDGFGNNLYTPVNGQYMEEGHYKAEVMKDKITIGIDTWQSGPNFGLSEISHLKAFDKNPLPKTHDISGEAYKTLFGTNPYDYT